MSRQDETAENAAARARIFGRSPTTKESVVIGSAEADTKTAVERDQADFRRVGLQPQLAERAARALDRGTYGSFREAAVMTSMFSDQPHRLDHHLLEKIVIERTSSGVVEERAMPSSTRPLVREAAIATTGNGALLYAQIISAGVGSSGYYAPEVLEAAAKAKVFHAGLHVYLDHPTESERWERPERSVRDLAGKLETDATYSNGALQAQIRVFETFRPLIVEQASAIGMSIRASAEVSGTRDGIPVIGAITEALSVDFVTRAGRGGRIISVS